VGAEDKFPVVLFVVIQAQLPHIVAECALMADALDERTRNVSEAGYRITELQAALDHLENIDTTPTLATAIGTDKLDTAADPVDPVACASPSSVVLNLGA